MKVATPPLHQLATAPWLASPEPLAAGPVPAFHYELQPRAGDRWATTWLGGDFAAITGCAPTALVPVIDWLTLVDVEDPVQAASHRAALRAGRASAAVLAVRGHDGVRRLWSDSAAPVWEPLTGTLQAVRGTVQEITQARTEWSQARHQAATFRALFNSTPLTVVVLDAAGRLMHVNERTLQVSGGVFGHQHRLGESFVAQIAAPYRNKVAEGVALALAGTPSSYERMVVDPHGATHWYEVFYAPVRGHDGQLLGVTISGLDLTARKQAEAELRQLSGRLQDNVVRLQDMAARAEAESSAKTAFLTTLSHEIRTPLNGLLGFSELLRETALSEQQRDWVDIIHHQSAALLELTNRILDLAKIAAAKVELEVQPFDVVELVEEVVDLFTPLLRRKPVALVHWLAPSIPSQVLGDRGRLRQILVNLVGNAVKFTDQGRIEIRVDVGDEGAGDGVTPPPGAGPGQPLLITVRDTGIGIPEDRRDLLFQPFSQVPGRHGRGSGSGLGLGICKTLCTLMGGRIWLDSEVGRGSRFCCLVYCHRLPAGAAAPADPALAAVHGRRFVLAGGDATTVALAQALAQRDGFQLDHCRQASALPGACTLAAGYAAALLVLPLAETEWLAFTAAWRALPQRPPLIAVAPPGGAPLSAAHTEYFARRLDLPLHHRDLLAALSQAPGDQRHHLPAPAPAPLFPLRVLLAEDNHFNQLFTQILLQRLGCTVTLASSGTELLAKLRATPCDTVLMDIQMPDMDGLEATRLIRHGAAGELARTCHLIALTAGTSPSERAACREAGMDDFVGKPLAFHDLEQALRRVPVPLAQRTAELKYDI